MKRVDWWVGILVLAGAIAAHALAQRFDWRIAGDPSGVQQLIRVDRLTGAARVVHPSAP